MNSLYTSIFRDTYLDEGEGVVLNEPLFLLPNEDIVIIPEDTPSWVKYKKEPIKTQSNIEEVSTSVLVKPAIETSFTPVYTNGKIDSKLTKEKFVSTFLPIYEKVLTEKGISKEYAKSLVAQAGHESAWGAKPIGHHKYKTNNYIGAKASKNEKGVTAVSWEEYNGRKQAQSSEFKRFNSIEDMAKYHINLLMNKRYNAFTGNVSDFASRVKAGGYATDSKYVDKLNKAIASIKNGGIFNK